MLSNPKYVKLEMLSNPIYVKLESRKVYISIIMKMLRL